MGRRGRVGLSLRFARAWALACGVWAAGCGPETGQILDGGDGGDGGRPDALPGGCTTDRECAARGLACDVPSGICVQCVRDANCPSGNICAEQRCVPGTSGCTDEACARISLACDHERGVCVQRTTTPVCTPGDARCAASGVREVCATDGSAFQPSPCGPGEACAAGRCQRMSTGALYGPCTSAAMCPGAGARCNTNFVGGSCTVACTTGASCGGGACLSNQCFRACSLGGRECGPAERCAFVSATQRICFASCDEGSGPRAGCGAGLACEPYSGVCADPAQIALLPGADNGAPCTANAMCRSGECVAELGLDGLGSGYLGGMCISRARFPSPAVYQPNQPVPRGNCPVGSVSISAEAGTNEGDSAVCFKGCTTGGECRAGYECNKRFFAGTAQTSTGFCSPINCLMAPYATMLNGGCPTGTLCQRRAVAGSTTVYGVCARVGT